MKYAKEVEGRLRGFPSLFMTAEEFTTHNFREVIERQPSTEHVDHIYVSDHKNTINPHSNAFAQWEDLIITLEVTYMPEDRKDYDSNVHIMLAIIDKETHYNGSFWNLKSSDQIKFTAPDKTVYCASKGSMLVTLPSDFKDDVTLW